MIDDYAIPLFGPLWWGGLVATALGCLALLAYARRLDGPRTHRLARIVAIVFLLRLAVYHVDAWARGAWFLGESLPLHLCGLSGFLGVALMLRPGQRLFEVVYYWGAIGALQALATPLLPAGREPIRIIDHYVGHGLILVFALWPILVWAMRPRRRSVLHVFLISQLLLPTIGAVNWVLGSNYMYLASRPEVANPFVIGEWPWYILGFEAALLLHLGLLYTPFALLARADSAPVTAGEAPGTVSDEPENIA